MLDGNGEVIALGDGLIVIRKLFGSAFAGDDETTSKDISSFNNAGMLAPYANITTTTQTYFSFEEANADGITHFRQFGNGTIGVEDLYGVGEQDFDDLILGFDFQLSI